MFRWLGKVKNFANNVIGKIKSGIGYVGSLFNRGKDMYRNIKDKIVNLPVVGGVAGDLIRKGEDAVGDYAKKKIGVDLEDVNRIIGKTQDFARNLPRVM